MPFENIKISASALATELTTTAWFGENSLFDTRTRASDATNKKQLVAEYIARHLTNDGGSALLTDGSSTFFVGLAISLLSRARVNQFHLATNNLALLSELNCRRTTPNIGIQILDGDFDYSLCAVFPRNNNWLSSTAAFVGSIIVSARSLYFHCGPTSPDFRSAILKRSVMSLQVPLIFAVDDEKLSDASWPFNAVLDLTEWHAMKQADARQICIVSNKPYDEAIGDFDTLSVGEEVAQNTRMNRSSWVSATNIERYCYQAFQFSELPHVSFVEVERT